MDLEVFKNTLRSKLKDKNLTLSTLSDLSELSEDTLRSVIYGKSHDVKLSTIIKIADAFECSIDELVNHNIYPPQINQLIKHLGRLPESSIKFIQIVISLEEKSLLSNSSKGIISIPLITPKCTLKDGMFYDRNHIEFLDISDYPSPIRKQAAFGIRIQTSFYEPTFFQNDILLFSTDRQPQYDDIILLLSANDELYIRRYTQLGFESLNGFGGTIPHKDLIKYTKLGIFIKMVNEFDIEQYR